MKSTNILVFGMCGVLATSMVNAGEVEKSSSLLKSRPNILLILADDLGYGDLSCQGSTDLKTPNIDRIFKEGIKFNNCYANSTVCSPSRAALLTGCYPDLVGVPGVIRTNEEDSWGYLSPAATLLPQELKKARYHTAIVGKWHLGLAAPNLPNLKGFDEFYGFLGDMMEDYYTHIRDNNNYMRINNQIVSPSGHATEVFTNWALDYLKRQEKMKDPFFLYLAYNAPHDPIQPPEEWHSKVTAREPRISEKRAKLVALIEHLDYSVGRVLNQLESSGQMENTLVIFVSDNGGNLNTGANNGPYRGGKGDLYDGGIRIPGGMMWKNVIRPGQTTDKLMLLMDLFPTICEIAGNKIQHPVDGVSLLPVLLGKPLTTDNRTVCFMRREGGMQYGGQIYYSALSRQYKIVQNTPWEEMQFFNLSDDPYEKHPLNKKGDKEYQQLFKKLTWHISLSGAVPWRSPSQVKELMLTNDK
jgi:arylsulfatase A-like enzyme